MGDNGLRKGVRENLFFTGRPEPLTIGHTVKANFKIIVVLGHEMPNTSLIELDWFYPILFADFVASYILGFIVRGRINTSHVVRLVIYIKIILLESLLGPTGFSLPLHQLLHQRVPLLAPALVETTLMLSLLSMILKYLLILSPVC